MELYLNGVNVTVPNFDNWPVVKSVPIPSSTQVIAVKGTDYGVVAGILASSSDGRILTSSNWKCTYNTPPSTWTAVGYDDSLWPAAVESYQNVNAPDWGTLSGISPSAWWIWTGPRDSNGAGFHSIAYCRYTL